MGRRARVLLAAVLSVLMGGVVSAGAEPIEITARIVRPDGAPIAGLDVRMVVGSQGASRSAGAGKRLRTDGSGRVVYKIDAPVEQRRIALDNMFMRHPSHHVGVGLEMELVGRPALYWIDVDLVKVGTVAGITAFVQGSGGGRFDRQLKFHSQTHSWSFPDEPEGMLMSDIGASVRQHEMTGEPGGPWKIDLVIEKQQFTVR